MTTDNLARFNNELNSFFALVMVNLVFGSIAMAFGIASMVTLAFELLGGSTDAGLRLLAYAFAMICFGLGLSLVAASRKILKGIAGIRKELRARKGHVPSELLTCWIVRLTTHYRENRATIRTMILICTLGGFCFLALGIIGSVQFFASNISSGTFVLNGYLLIVPALLAFCAATVSLASSFYFKTFSAAWDHRQEEIDRSECELARKLGRS